MSDVVSLGRKVTTLDVSPRFSNYTKVVIHVDDETVIEVGNSTGRTLELDNPFGTQQMAQDILDKLVGFQYQPFTADGALLDPAAEIGDAANIRGTYGGIYTRSKNFGRLMKSDISAPADEEIDHEYKYESPQKREFTRQIDDVKASLIIANNRIDATVSQKGGNNQTFGWSLLASEFGLYANGKKVFYVNQDGAHVNGEITATSGKIGGFTIGTNAIYNNLSSFGGTQSSGVYLGTDGLQLGKRFKVTPSGYVTADSMTLTGTLTVGGQNITAAALRSGAQSAYNNASYWSGGSNYGYSYGNAVAQYASSYPSYFTCARLNAKTGITMVGRDLGITQLTYKDGNGNTRTASFVTAR